MQVKMTERDKKLIVFLAIVVIVVAIGYWGVRPALISVHDDKITLEELEFMKQRNEQKMQMIPILEQSTLDAQAEIDTLKEEFYPMMTADEIDKMFTGMVLSKNLFAYDLGIDIEDSPAEFQAYQYSQMFMNPVGYNTEEGAETSEGDGYSLEEQIAAIEAEEAEAAAAAAKRKSESDSDSTTVTPEFDDSAAEETTVNSSVYVATVSMRLGGSKEELLKLIDELAKTDKRMMITSYAWSESNSLVEGNGNNLGSDSAINSTVTEMTADGEYTVVNRVELNIELLLFMYQE